MSKERLYPLNTSDEPGGDRRFDGGWIGDTAQVLIKYGNTEIVLLWFEPNGKFEKVETIPVQTHDDEDYFAFKNRYDAMVERWQAEHGVVRGMLRLREFSISKPIWVNIARYTEDLFDFINEPERFSEREAKRKQKILVEWEGREAFVLWWGMSEYWMDKSGYIIST